MHSGTLAHKSTLQPSAPLLLQDEGVFEESLQAVLGIQANPEHEDAEDGLITAQHTAADYTAAAEQGQLAVQSQLHFVYPTSQTILERARSILTLNSKNKQQPGALPSPQSDGEHTPTQRRRRYATASCCS